jgi:hypothetical protein
MPVNLVEDKSIRFERISPKCPSKLILIGEASLCKQQLYPSLTYCPGTSHERGKLVISMRSLEEAQMFVKFFPYCTMFLLIVSYAILFNIIEKIAPLY